jgi:hypothetical protein
MPHRARFVYLWLAALTCAVTWIELRRTMPRRLDHLEVERLDVVEPDGKPRIILAGAQRFPGIIWKGKEYPHPGREKGGVLFFNDDGTEAGGMIYTNAGAIFTMDQHDQDQTLALLYDDDSHGRAVGLVVNDPPAQSLFPVISAGDPHESEARANAMPPTQMRFYAGKQKNGSAGVWLFDKDGKPRLRLEVDAAGEPVLEFFDAAGNSVARMPPTQPR